MKINKCWDFNCPYRFIDPKPVKEREAFGLTTWECPDIIHCFAPDGVCIRNIEKENGLKQEAEELEQKKIVMRDDEKTYLFAVEGDELYEMIMHASNDSLFEYSGRFFLKRDNKLYLFSCHGHFAFEKRKTAGVSKYSPFFSVELPKEEDEQ